MGCSRVPGSRRRSAHPILWVRGFAWDGCGLNVGSGGGRHGEAKQVAQQEAERAKFIVGAGVGWGLEGKQSTCNVCGIGEEGGSCSYMDTDRQYQGS